MNCLYLIWSNQVIKQEFVIGRLTYDETYQFEYCYDCILAEQHGWRKLFAFQDEKVYESQTMFPVFASRLPDQHRRDIQQILEKYGMTSYDEFDLLSKSGGKLPIDNYKFVNIEYAKRLYINK